MVTPIEQALDDLLRQAGVGRSVSPEQVARAGSPQAWRQLLPHVRAAAVDRARQGRLLILRHGKPADPETLKGVYRLKLPDAER